MAVIGWGKPRIFTKRIDNEGSAWKEVPIPVEDSTTLETTKGDKTEAKLEGGSNEDVKYGANTYALSYTIRVAKGKTQPFEQNDGYVAGEYLRIKIILLFPIISRSLGIARKNDSLL